MYDIYYNDNKSTIKGGITMVINTNMMSLTAHRHMQNNSASQSSTMKKLSSGLRINSAADDSAGLAIAEKMKNQIKGLTQASKNAQDGISLIQTAEGALDETHAMLTRMRELSLQSLNDTINDSDRQKLDLEVQQLLEEIEGISQKTEFNDKPLLQGSTSTEIETEEEELPEDASAFEIAMYDMGNAKTIADEMIYELASLESDGAISPWSDIQSFLSQIEDPSQTTWPTDLVSESTGKHYAEMGLLEKLMFYDEYAGGSAATSCYMNISLTDMQAIDEAFTDIAYYYTQASTLLAESANESVTYANGVDENGVESVTYNESSVTYANGVDENDFSVMTTSETVVAINDEEIATIEDELEEELDDELEDELEEEIIIPDPVSFNFQVGANKYQQITVTIGAMGVDALGLTDLSTSTKETASAALQLIDAAIDTVSTQRANLGATQNRLEHTIKNVDNTTENLQSAESTIRDTDMASAMMEMTKYNILVQASQSMLSQANQVPQQVVANQVPQQGSNIGHKRIIHLNVEIL